MRLCAQTMRAQALWMSVEVVVGVGTVQCHAIMDVVIGVLVMQYHAIIDVVIGVRVMLCYQATDNSGFSTSYRQHVIIAFSVHKSRSPLEPWCMSGAVVHSHCGGASHVPTLSRSVNTKL